MNTQQARIICCLHKCTCKASKHPIPLQRHTRYLFIPPKLVYSDRAICSDSVSNRNVYIFCSLLNSQERSGFLCYLSTVHTREDFLHKMFIYLAPYYTHEKDRASCVILQLSTLVVFNIFGSFCATSHCPH